MGSHSYFMRSTAIRGFAYEMFFPTNRPVAQDA